VKAALQLSIHLRFTVFESRTMVLKSLSEFRMFYILTFVVLAQPVHGVVSAQVVAPLITDRPDQTESATVVSRGLIQIETGYLFSRNSGLSTHEVPGTLLRVGLGLRTELRIGHDGVIGSKNSYGAGDSSIGFKLNLIDSSAGWRPEFAVLATTTLPTGDRNYSSSGFDPNILLSFAHEISPNFSLGYNVGTNWESSGEAIDRDALFVYSLAFGRTINERISAFLEVFGSRQIDGLREKMTSVDGGLVFLLDDTFQVDIYIGRGIIGVADDVFLGAGVSLRLPY
tara:strand:- start:17506 stop:18357 length:852 start_codon:yes stop_codon:yes gene_type:complete